MYKLCINTLASNIYPVTKYVSSRTGLTVLITYVKGFTVQCSVLIATEPENDEGYVHALEHLIFNGSKKYPQRGFLNKLAEGINAGSNVDHTIVSFSTAGEKCFSDLIPIVLDHIMFPLLTEEDYLLDFHHIDGHGQDGGLVYEEMKDTSDDSYKRMVLKFQKEMYPGSGYSYDHCGSAPDIRTSANISKLRQFHERYYRPENITMVITGEINHSDDVLKKLVEFEDEIIALRDLEPVKKWMKPWQSIPPTPNYGEYSTVGSTSEPNEYKNDTQGSLCIDSTSSTLPVGVIFLGWRGPVRGDASSQKDITACEILLNYITWRSAAPLHKLLVDAGLAGIVSSDLSRIKHTQISIEIFDIPLDKMKITRDITLDYLKGVGISKNPIGMEIINIFVHDEINDMQKTTDWDPHLDMTTRCVTCLHLETDDEFECAMLKNPKWHLKELLNEPAEYWSGLCRKYFTDDVVIVTGALTEVTEFYIEEKARQEQQRRALGEQALAEKAKLLNNAKMYRASST